ncbi:hypothetical protein AB0G74_11755 [Streptomyces sp. NPDC020875]|uniref:hypothetical protein n=1 Tax=Streptomyces sp. NPDC020875 TaxID=3154898 RepID=UPI0033C7D481
MTDTPADDRSSETAREPAWFAACQVNGAPGVDHAAGPRGTLCGIAARCVTYYLHLFEPEALQSCRRCRHLAENTPPGPSVQERLHNRVLAATGGPARDDLLAALRRGAAVTLWIDGPARSLTRSYAALDELSEGKEPAARTLLAAETIGLARVEADPWRFLVVLPGDGTPPLVARGPHPRP